MQRGFFQWRNGCGIIAIENVRVTEHEIRHRAGVIRGVARRVRLHSCVSGFGPVVEQLLRHWLQRSRRHERTRHAMAAQKVTLALLALRRGQRTLLGLALARMGLGSGFVGIGVGRARCLGKRCNSATEEKKQSNCESRTPGTHTASLTRKRRAEQGGIVVSQDAYEFLVE